MIDIKVPVEFRPDYPYFRAIFELRPLDFAMLLINLKPFPDDNYSDIKRLSNAQLSEDTLELVLNQFEFRSIAEVINSYYGSCKRLEWEQFFNLVKKTKYLRDKLSGPMLEDYKEHFLPLEVIEVPNNKKALRMAVLNDLMQDIKKQNTSLKATDLRDRTLKHPLTKELAALYGETPTESLLKKAEDVCKGFKRESR